jgi:hypothetical protein
VPLVRPEDNAVDPMTAELEPLTDDELGRLLEGADAHEPPEGVKVSGWMPIFTGTVRALVAEIRRNRASPSDKDLERIERCLPPLDEDGSSRFAVGPLGSCGDESFDTDDVRALVAEVRRYRAPLEGEDLRRMEASLDSGEGFYLQDRIDEAEVRGLLREVRRLKLRDQHQGSALRRLAALCGQLADVVSAFRYELEPELWKAGKP